MDTQITSKSDKEEYMLGVLETTLSLLNTSNAEILKFNIQHLQKILPIVIDEIKGQSTLMV
ncbi:hypothetical protein EBU91_02180 [bacterium]|jgi:hypothetical protein|nr:hypothetical protein [bacterium]